MKAQLICFDQVLSELNFVLEPLLSFHWHPRNVVTTNVARTVKNVAPPVSDPPKIYYIWRIWHTSSAFLMSLSNVVYYLFVSWPLCSSGNLEKVHLLVNYPAFQDDCNTRMQLKSLSSCYTDARMDWKIWVLDSRIIGLRGTWSLYMVLDNPHLLSCLFEVELGSRFISLSLSGSLVL